VRNWSIRGEYLYVQLGSTTFALNPLQNFITSAQLFTSNPPCSRVSFNDNGLRVDANYRFAGRAPTRIATRWSERVKRIRNRLT